MKSEKTCGNCMFCMAHKFDNPTEYCINEESEHYGKALGYKEVAKQSCDKWKGHEFDMSFKEALQIVVSSKPCKICSDYFTPQDTVSRPTRVLQFKSNADLVRYREACSILYTEYINMRAEEDGLGEEDLKRDI